MGLGMNKSTSSQKSEPWKEQQPYLKEVFEGAQNQYQNATPLQGADGIRQFQFDQAADRAGYSPGQKQGGKGPQVPGSQSAPGSQPEQALGNWLTDSLSGQGEQPVNTGSNPYAGQANPYMGAQNQYVGQGNSFLPGLAGPQAPVAAGENAYLERLAGSQGRNEAID